MREQEPRNLRNVRRSNVDLPTKTFTLNGDVFRLHGTTVSVLLRNKWLRRFHQADVCHVNDMPSFHYERFRSFSACRDGAAGLLTIGYNITHRIP